MLWLLLLLLQVEFSPVDKVIATCSGDRTVKVWSISDCSCLRTFQVGSVHDLPRAVCLPTPVQAKIKMVANAAKFARFRQEITTVTPVPVVVGSRSRQVQLAAVRRTQNGVLTSTEVWNGLCSRARCRTSRLQSTARGHPSSRCTAPSACRHQFTE